MYPMFRAMLVLLVLVLPAACTQPALQDEVCAGFAPDTLYLVKNSGFAEACARSDAALSGYRAIDAQPLGVSHIDIPQTNVAGTRRRDWEMTGERQDALRTGWADAMDQAFAGYPRATGGPAVLRIEAELTRIAPGRPTATTIGGALQPVGSTQDVMEISAEFRLVDGNDGRLLAVIRDSRTITTVAMSRTAPASVTILFGSWAALLHTRVAGK
jgi:hypothetical protein